MKVRNYELPPKDGNEEHNNKKGAHKARGDGPTSNGHDSGAEPDGGEHWTELRNARRLVRRHGKNIRYVHASKAWLLWTGTYWRRDDNGGIVRLAKDTIEAIFDEAKSLADEQRTALRKFALKSQSCGQLRAMTELAQDDLGVILAPEALDADPLLLGVTNGTIELTTGQFRQSRREDYITKLCAVAFDQAAQCPNWEAFQTKISNKDADLVAYKRRMFGLFLTGLMEEILFMTHGAGANGKSTELETIHSLLGDYAHACDARILLSGKKEAGPTPELLALKGKRAVFINETDESDHLNEARVKYLAGNDTLCARGLHENPINFRPTHKSILRTNHIPKIRGTDLGIWRRIHYVPYLVTIPEDEQQKRFREQILTPEHSGILNWMLAGLRDYLADGLRPPPIVCKATKAYRDQMDSVGKWIQLFCMRSEIGAKLSLKTLYASYEKWAKDEIGWTASNQKLADQLREHGYESRMVRGVTEFLNIRLLNTEAEPF